MTYQYYFNAKPKLLAVLQMGGATDQIFTAQQIVSFVGKYIESKKLYDPQNKRIVRCKNDLLGEIFECDEFIVNENAHKNLWKLVTPYLSLALKKDLQTRDSKPNKDGECSRSDQQPQLPWWYFVKRNNENASQTTGKRSYDLRETIGVQDSDYGESELDEIYEEYEPVDIEDSDTTLSVSSDDNECPSSEVENCGMFQSETSDDSSGNEASTEFTGSFDSDIALEDYWLCLECKTRNSPTVGYCQRCWKLRKGWVKNHETLARSATDPLLETRSSAKPSRSASLDVTDGVGKIGVKEFTPNALESESDSITMIPSLPSPLKHKLEEENRSESSEASLQTKTKKMHLNLPESSDAVATTTPSGSDTNANPFPGLCNLCQNQPNDAIFVHGAISHQFCCYKCAKRLKKKGKSCPICREPIVHISRNFIYQF